MRYFLSLFLIFFLVSGCSKYKEEDENVIASINDYQLTLKEFQKLFVEELVYDNQFKPTREAREDFLDNLIRKELLIQEAVKFKLDRNEKFIRSIERYWEATLIRELLELKNREIQETVYVTEEEIEKEYRKRYGDHPDSSNEKAILSALREELTNQKKQQGIESWINSLREKSAVTINRNFLDKGNTHDGE